MLEEAIYNEITQDAQLASILSRGSGKFNVYPLRVPEGVTPEKAITYTEILHSRVYPQVHSVVIQFNCIAKTLGEAREIATHIERVFDDLSARQLGGVFGITYVSVIGRSALFDSDAGVYIYPVDVRFKY